MSVGSMSVVIAFALGCVSLFVGHVPPFRDAGRAKMSTRWITTSAERWSLGKAAARTDIVM